MTTRYDALRRPVEVRADGVAIRRFVYGENHPDAEARNLRGQIFRVYDGAGVLTHERYDHHGNLEVRTRRVPSAHESVAEFHQPLVYDALPGLAPDGTDPLATDATDASVAPSLEPALREQIEHDALSRPVVETLHDGSVLRPRYNEAGVLDALDVELDGRVQNVIADIDYDARGQRTRVEYAGGGFTTTYRYDPLTFRLVTLRTVRASDGAALQHLAYTYDAAGSITSILDHAVQDRIPGHDLAAPHRFFDYDALGRLVEATGRAIPRYAPASEPGAGDDPRDPGGLRLYTERYTYDVAGNARERAFRVDAAPGLRQGFTQRFEVEAGQLPSGPTVHSNRLVATERTAHPASGADDTTRIDYTNDAAGSLLTLGLGTVLSWSPEHRLGRYSRTAVDAAYAYDATGERVRKVVSAGESRRERVYFDYFERYRELRPDGSELERTTLNVTDGDRRVLLVERENSGVPRLRFQLGDHLDTVALEVDETGAEITYSLTASILIVAARTQQPRIRAVATDAIARGARGHPIPRDFIAKRICVVGCSGAGKSTFSRRCAALGYAHLELDGVVHQADWQPLPDDEAHARIDRFTTEHEHWVVDGNYTRFRDLLWGRADTIVWLDPDRWTVSYGVARRSLRRLVRREMLWNGNRERWSEVFSSDPERSVILWAWRRYPHYREEYSREMHSPRWAHLRWIRLPSRRAAQALLDESTSETGLAVPV